MFDVNKGHVFVELKNFFASVNSSVYSYEALSSVVFSFTENKNMTI